jgi:replication factor A1
MRNKASPAEYLAFLSLKYEVDPDRLFYALISASENQKSTCESLSIECRGKQRNKVVLLITKDTKVVAQFPITEEFLSEQNNPIKEIRKMNVFRRHTITKDSGPHSFQIGDLRKGMKRVNLRAKVLEIAKPTLVFTRFGNYACVANALIADDTGTIKLCLWNEQIDSVSIGDTVQIENASTSMFRGERQLRIGKKGILRNMGILSKLEEVHTL